MIKNIATIIPPRLWERYKKTFHSLAFVVIVSGLIGFLIGSIGYPSPHDAVEAAQVFVQKVDYSIPTPFYHFTTATWTILNHILALCLLGGMSEITLSYAVSGLMGMLSFVTLSVCVYALCKRPFISIAAPFFVVFGLISTYHVNYPILFFGIASTYGILGRMYVLLVISLLSLQRYRVGGFLLGLSLCVHPSMGAYLIALVLLSCLFAPKSLWDTIKRMNIFFILGLSISLLSFFVHMKFIYDVPRIDPNEASEYLHAFIRAWDYHRRPVDFQSSGVYLAATAFLFSGFWLVFCKKCMPQRGIFILRMIVLYGLVSFGAAVLSIIRPERLPDFLLISMPTRLFDIPLVAMVPLLIGFLAQDEKNAFNTVFLIVILFFFLLISIELVPLFAGPCVIFGASFIIIVSRCIPRRDVSQKDTPRRYTRIFHGVLCCLLCAMVILWSYKAYFVGVYRRTLMKDYTNSEPLSIIAKDQGILLTAHKISLMQLRTRRPVLVNGSGIDGLSYEPSVGPFLNHVLKKIYGVDLFNPPQGLQRNGQIPLEPNKTVWQGRSKKEWQAIRWEFGVTNVLAYGDWKLDLPLIWSSPGYSYYVIPGE